jgi:hypothetical protein
MHRFIHLFLFLLTCNGLLASTDWGSSHYLHYQHTLSDNWFLLHRSTLSTRNDFEQSFFKFGDLAIGYKLNKATSIRVGYRIAALRIGNDWRDEQRPFIGLRHFKAWKGYLISHKPRFEFRQFNYRDDYVRFRYEFRVEGPWKFTKLGIRPYLEEEVFFSFDKGQIEANWFTLGLNFKPTDDIKIKIGHRWLKQRIGNTWIHRHVISTGLMFFF